MSRRNSNRAGAGRRRSEEMQASTAGKLLGSLATVFAPLTVLTALLYYVGWQRTTAYFGHFGISSALVGFSPQDYILRSDDIGFGVAAWVVTAGIVLYVLDRMLGLVLRRLADTLSGRLLRWSLLTIGVLLLLFGLASANGKVVILEFSPLVGAGLLALGTVALLRFGAPWLGISGTILAVTALAMAAFWCATIYAREVGQRAAEAVDADPGLLAMVTVYSDKPLDLPGALVESTRAYLDDHEWHYRYTGANLLTYANGRWFLVTNASSPDFGSSVTILRDDDAIRVETSVAKRTP